MRDQTLAQLVTDMPDDDLRAARRDAAVGLSLLRPGSAMYGPAHVYLGLLDAELARRRGAGQAASPSPRPGPSAPRGRTQHGPPPQAKDYPHDPPARSR